MHPDLAELCDQFTGQPEESEPIQAETTLNAKPTSEIETVAAEGLTVVEEEIVLIEEDTSVEVVPPSTEAPPTV